MSPRPIALLAATAAWLSGCDIINPEEQVPAFVRIERYGLASSHVQVPPVHQITDVWVYVDEELVGTYELPAEVPILSDGPTSLRIRPGVRVSGQVGSRLPNPFMEDLVATVPLFPDSVVTLAPVTQYREWVNFLWREDFEGAGHTLGASPGSQGSLDDVVGEEAHSGKSVRMSLPEGQFFVEYTGPQWLVPSATRGEPVILEFSYRCDHPLVVGAYVVKPGGSEQFSIITLAPREDWNHLYLNLTELTASSATIGAYYFRVFLGMVRNTGSEVEQNAHLDNIRLMH